MLENTVTIPAQEYERLTGKSSRQRDNRYVKVWNRDNEIYEEMFKGQKMSIQPQKYILMNRREAINFLGTHSGADPRQEDDPTRRGGKWKMLDVEVITEEEYKRLKGNIK